VADRSVFPSAYPLFTIRHPPFAIRFPMRLLALDTSTEACSVALLLDAEIRLRCEITERSHAELVLPMVDDLLREAGLGLQELDALAFGRGPGAFTGLRIATGVVQGLALGANRPVVAVSSLAAVAEQVSVAVGGTVLACNDARMGEVYWGVFRRETDGGMSCVGPEVVSPPEAVGAGVPPARHAAGNALARYPALAARLASAGLRLYDGIRPRADAVARLGRLEFAAGRILAPEMALPTYIRDDVAQPSTRSVTQVS
jgi:tRNA threonylcarbamoyladenosine biosynthesis protein TsaB